MDSDDNWKSSFGSLTSRMIDSFDAKQASNDKQPLTVSEKQAIRRSVATSYKASLASSAPASNSGFPKQQSSVSRSISSSSSSASSAEMVNPFANDFHGRWKRSRSSQLAQDKSSSGAKNSQLPSWLTSSVASSSTMVRPADNSADKAFKYGLAYRYTRPLHSTDLHKSLFYQRTSHGISYHIRNSRLARKQFHRPGPKVRNITYTQPRVPAFLVSLARKRLLESNRNISAYKIDRLSPADIFKIALAFSGIFTPAESDAIADAMSTKNNRTISRLQVNHDNDASGGSVSDTQSELLRGQRRIWDRMNFYHNRLNARLHDDFVPIISTLILVADSWAFRVAGFSNTDVHRSSVSALKTSMVQHLESEGYDKHDVNHGYLNDIIDTVCYNVAPDLINRIKEQKRH